MLAFLVATAALVVTLAIRSSIAMQGFPDGHRTDLDRAVAALAGVVMPGLVAFAVNFTAISVVGWRRDVRWWFGISLVVLAILATASWMNYDGLAARFDDGQGG